MLIRAVVGWLAMTLLRLSLLLVANQALSGASAATSRGWKYLGCNSPPGANSPVLFSDAIFHLEFLAVVCIYMCVYVVFVGATKNTGNAFPFTFSNARTFSNAPSTVLFDSLRFPQRFCN